MTSTLLVSGGILAALLAVPSATEKEAMVRAVTVWDQNCSGDPRGSWDNMAAAWYNEITNGAPPPFGHFSERWNKTAFYSNSWAIFTQGAWQTQYVIDSDFTDPDRVGWGKDYTDRRLDDVDAAMIALHGGPKNDGWAGSMKFDQSGTGDCKAEQAHMDFGDVDLEFLHLSSCTSMQSTQWHPAWTSSFKGVHQIDGFHGLMYIYNDTPWWDRYKDFAKDSFKMPITVAWLDNMYRYTCAVVAQDPIIVQRQDQCPVMRGVGVSPGAEANFWDRAMSERYDNVLSDPVNPAWQGALTLLACDPLSGDPIGGVITPCDPFPFANPGGTGGGSTKTGTGGYAAQVDDALPTWDATILAAAPGPDWMSALSLAQVGVAVGDTVPSSAVSSGGLSEANDAAHTYQTDLGRGRVRYVNRTRQFSFTSSPHVPWSESASRSVALGVAAQLGIPSSELTPNARVDTVAGYGFLSTSPSSTPSATTLAERMVTIERTIHGLPVVESMVRAAVSNTGLVARLLVRWPTFKLRTGIALRPRQEVVDDIVAHLNAEEGGQSVGIYIHLAYGRVGNDYLPVAVVQYADAASGELMMVPLVGQAPDRDLDGKPDATDNCISTPNSDQVDGDSDGVGDACDNCPAAANAGQQDENQDGSGDVCAELRGACQMTGGLCDVATAADCLASSGSYQGNGTTCTGVATPKLLVNKTNLEWTATPAAASYDVVRGDLGLLRSSGGDFALATVECVVDDRVPTSLPYALDPGPGQSWYYLVRQQSGGLYDSYDAHEWGQLETRDIEIAASGVGCR